MARIAVFGPRQSNDILLTQSDGKVWRELVRVITEDLVKPEWKGHTFLIPIYSKFDLLVLKICEQKKYDVEFYIPKQNWGKTGLPYNKTQLVNRMMRQDNTHIIPGNVYRLNSMLRDSDGVYLLDCIPHFGPMQEALNSKPIRRVPTDNMAFQSEDELIGQTELLFPGEDENPGVDINPALQVPHDTTKTKYISDMQKAFFANGGN